MIFLMLLMVGCGSPIVKTEYIKPTIPELPAPPDYYEVAWQKVGELYCVDGQGAKGMLKNWELSKDYVAQHQQIFEGLR